MNAKEQEKTKSKKKSERNQKENRIINKYKYNQDCPEIFLPYFRDQYFGVGVSVNVTNCAFPPAVRSS
jgi:hypothetical protein